MKAMVDYSTVIDWFSVKMTGVTVGLAVVTGNGVLIALGAVATASTIIYNAIRIYKELRNKKEK